MLGVLTSAILFTILLIYVYQKNKRITIGILVISFYLLINLAGLFLVDKFNPYFRYSSAASIYFFIICLLSFLPLIKKNSIVARGFNVQQTSYFKVIIRIYLFLALILTISNIHILNEVLVGGNFAQLKQLAYDGDLKTDNSLIFLFARIYVSSLSSAVMLYGFYIAKDSQIPYYKSMFYILAGLVPTFVTNILYTYRGGIGVQVLIVICCYFLMRRYYSKERERQFYLTFGIIFVFLIAVMISITVSRFGERSTGDSILDYFGQSFLNFNGGVADRIHSYANGQYFFGTFLGLTRDDVCKDFLYGISSNNGNNLHTFVGNLVLDFGFVGGFIVTCAVSWLLDTFLCNKRNYDFADSALLMFYLDFLFSGAFHSPFGFAKSCVYFLIIYIFLKIPERRYRI